jgi:hypothetical protein
MRLLDILRPLSSPPVEIVLVRLDSDEAKTKALEAKIDAAKASLGDRFLLHPSNRVQRKG